MAKPDPRAPTDYERFSRLLYPSADEVSRMLADLRRVLGKYRKVKAVTGASDSSLRKWSSGEVHPGIPSSRLVWLTWCMICRPDEIQTVRDLVTCGRFTKRGDPATAGNRIKGRWHGRGSRFTI